MKLSIKSTIFGFVSVATMFVAGQGIALADYNYGGGGSGGGSSSGGGYFVHDDRAEREQQERNRAEVERNRVEQERNRTEQEKKNKNESEKKKGRVLGASTYNFQKNLTKGHRGNDVTELQKMLIAEGHMTGEATGYFGSVTKSSLSKWQAKNGLPATGYFGPMTRAQLTKING